MKKILIACIAVMMCMSCARPVLNSNDYTVIDTLNINYNAFNMLYGYNVIIGIDSTYFYGTIGTDGDLNHIGRKIDIERLK